MEGKQMKSTFNFSKRKKKNCFLLIPLKEDGLGPSIHLGGGAQATEKQPEVSPSKSTFDFSVSAYEQMKVP